MNMRAYVAAAGACLALAGCEEFLTQIDLERMIDQPRADAYEASPFFSDGRVMQHPPDGTVPARRARPPIDWFEPGSRERYLTRIPVSVDRPLLEYGRNRFDIACAVCHGVDGSGNSQVAHNMILRKPPSLVEARVQSFAAGRVFRVISQGYGLMPSYAHMLDPRARWAVVAYLRALGRSQGTPLASLPEPLRRRAQEALQ